MKKRGSQQATDMGYQFFIRARSHRPSFPRGRADGTFLRIRNPMRIHRRSVKTTHLTHSLQPVASARGDRAGFTQGFDLRRGKGRPSSTLSILCSSNSLAIVSSPTLACKRETCSSRGSWDRFFRPNWPADKKSERDLKVGPFRMLVF